MNDLLAKISSYNIFNYLFPGAVLGVLAEWLRVLDFGTRDVITRLVLYYFIGLCISRIGSVVFEPILKGLKFVRYAAYPSYLEACEKDPEMNVMVEVSNTYRTLTAAFALLPISMGIKAAADGLNLSPSARYAVLSLALLTLFAFSYRKQASFVRQRVEHYTSSR
jgi:hypothetical protein